MTRKKLILDLDDVIYNFIGPFSRFVKELGDKELDPMVMNFTIDQLYDSISMNYQTLHVPFDFVYYYDKFIELWSGKSMPLMEPKIIKDCLKDMLSIKPLPEVYFVTARFLNFQYDTHASLNGLFQGIGCCNIDKTIFFSEKKVMPKMKLVKQVGADFFVDNCPTYIKEVKSLNPDTYCVLYLPPPEYGKGFPLDVQYEGADAIATSWDQISELWFARC